MFRVMTFCLAVLVLMAAVVFTTRQVAAGQDAGAANPLLVPSGLPFQAPPFDRIQDAHFRPAFEAGMREQLAEVEAIANSPAPPAFDNTLVALERSGQTLLRVQLAFHALTGANTNDALQALEEEMAPRLAAHQDAIVLNEKLFDRIESLHDRRTELNLDPESLRLLEYTYQQFVMAGARLGDEQKAQLEKLNEEDAALNAKFSNQLLKTANEAAVVIADRAELAGLPDIDVAAAAEAAKSRGLDGQWVLALRNTTQQPALQSLTSRPTREKLFGASWTRAQRGGEHDTRDTITRLAEIRAQKAQLLDQPSFAAWKLQDQMAKTPEQVHRFIGDLVSPATEKARAEAADIQGMIDRQGGGFTLQPWDWDFYAEQVRKARYDLDEEQLKPYFELDRVLRDGVFYAAGELYGITFHARNDIPVYHPDVRVFEVREADGAALGLFYTDYFTRPNKNGGAWMNNLVLQSSLLGTKPVIYNVANFTKPSPGQPALLSFDDVSTLFHEFGHTLHGLFASQRYPSLSGTSVARDFVEFPSQINEHWALEPRVLERYARHHETGAPMAAELVEKIKQSRTFNQGYELAELVSAAALDMEWHTLPPSREVDDVGQFEAEALAKANVNLPQVPPRYRSSYFLHIWSHGYSAGYYAYLWTEMLDQDAYGWFEEHGGMTRENGQRFRDLILSRGNTRDYAEMYREFRGRDPIIEPMLEHRGLAPSAAVR